MEEPPNSRLFICWSSEPLLLYFFFCGPLYKFLLLLPLFPVVHHPVGGYGCHFFGPIHYSNLSLYFVCILFKISASIHRPNFLQTVSHFMLTHLAFISLWHMRLKCHEESLMWTVLNGTRKSVVITTQNDLRHWRVQFIRPKHRVRKRSCFASLRVE